MKLVEIKNLFTIDYGAPSPLIIANDDELYLTFYIANEGYQHLDIPHQRSESNDIGICILKFKSYLKYTFGAPSNETIGGHPYYKLGMRSASFYELEGSDLVKQLQNIANVHPYYKPERWSLYKHYIVTFHDNMFECVAQEFVMELQNKTLNSQATVILEAILKHNSNQ